MTQLATDRAGAPTRRLATSCPPQRPEMNPLRAVPTGGDGAPAHDEPVADEYPREITTDEPDYDPAADPEAMLLCALMDAYDPTANSIDVARIIATLSPDDFDDPAHARLFAVIGDLAATGAPHDFASVTGALIRSGADGAKDAPLRRRLMGIVTAGAHAVAAVHYADNVLSQSYRRSFHLAGRRLVQAAEEGPEADLFDYMVELGTAQRALWNRISGFRRGER